VLVSEKNDYNPLKILIGIGPSPVGDVLLAWDNDASNGYLVCFLAFIKNVQELKSAKADLAIFFPRASFHENNKEAKKLITNIFNTQSKAQIRIFINGTEFQKRVWRTLTEVNFGTVISYQELAQLMGNINSTRAVASAVAKNNISYLIPCHRIIRKSGDINKYRWGSDVKRKLIDWESEVLK
jgi:AraC family transcriptional regulator, regulatory protein of adaptative response / methylated-DNA-[protein]-cysteine methyltransferase